MQGINRSGRAAGSYVQPSPRKIFGFVSQPHPGSSLLGAVVHLRQQRGTDGERPRVEPERPTRAGGGDEQAAERAAQDLRRVDTDAQERVRVLQ